MVLDIITTPTTPVPGQKPGTSGLRKKVVTFQQPHYLANFLQATFNALPSGERQGASLVLGGDGRFFNNEAIQVAVRMAFAAGFRRVLVGRDGILSTPAVSATIRRRKALGGIILTASHNPGGPDGDFGVKYNGKNGGPAPEALTNAIYEASKSLNEYHEVQMDNVDLGTVGEQQVADDGCVVQVIDPVEDYEAILRECFDFDDLRVLLTRPDFRFLFDGMNAVTGIYAKRIFVDALGAPAESVIRAEPLPDFGGLHPDPNLVYNSELVRLVDDERKPVHLGAASDGDGDRNMILGHKSFVNPSDSVAMIAANAHTIPYFARQGGLKGLARSMPTSSALDHVAHALNVPNFEVPTGWKFFGNLMDAGQLSICGEESFGTSSDHVREKDGIWAVLCWLTILQDRNRALPVGTPLVGIDQIQKEHWARFGRSFFTRHDFEEVDAVAADKVMSRLRGHLAEWDQGVGLTGKRLGDAETGIFEVATADDFAYNDPIDGSVTAKQGIRFVFRDDSRIVFRLSGTGSSGATIRMYIEKYETDQARHGDDVQDILKPLLAIAHELSGIAELTGRTEPTVIT